MTAIEAKELSKVYRLYSSPAQRLREIVTRRPLHTPFVALEGISFDIQRGETFGIIGENGAGKSTLLKILARTLKPTSGTLTVKGRTAALLELGAGFNPELSGEENIYLNAFLLGLSKKEVDDRREAIIGFSELGDFIGRPVKTYSSGMHVRLAFSIATSVDPEILIIDEALSVGDQHFQKKSVDRMMRFRSDGKTIIFCSHSLYLVQELCSRAVWLKHGRIEKIGETASVINSYTDWVRERDAGFRNPEELPPRDTGADREEKLVWVESARVTDGDGREQEVLRTGQSSQLRIVVRTADTASPRRSGHIAIGLNRNDGVPVYGVTTKMDGFEPLTYEDGLEIRLSFPALPLLSGQYHMMVFLGDEHALHPYDIFRTKAFSVENVSSDVGMVRIPHDWTIGGAGLPPEKDR